MAGYELTGRYWPVRSFWHERDPRTKLGLVMGCLLLVIGIPEIKAQLLMLVVILFLYLTAKLPLRSFIGNLKAFRWLIFITFLANIVFVRGGKPLPQFSYLTGMGLQVAILYGLRIVNLLVISFWLMMTVRPLDLIAALEKLFRPLQRWLPIGEFVLAMGLAVRFFPLILEESEEIRLAQQARGGRCRSVLKSMATLAVPLFVGVVRRSGELAEAMESRGYKPGVPRTEWRGFSWNTTESLTLSAIWVGLLLLAVVIYKLG